MTMFLFLSVMALTGILFGMNLTIRIKEDTRLWCAVVLVVFAMVCVAVTTPALCQWLLTNPRNTMTTGTFTLFSIVILTTGGCCAGYFGYIGGCKIAVSIVKNITADAAPAVKNTDTDVIATDQPIQPDEPTPSATTNDVDRTVHSHND
jgi:hypothetical protein